MNSKNNKKELIEALQWQMDAGVDYSFGELSPLKNLSKKNQPEKQLVNQENFESKEITQTKLLQANTNTKSYKQPQEKSSFQNFMESKTPSYNIDEEEGLIENAEFIKKAEKLAIKSKNLEELRSNIEKFDGLSITKLAKNCVFSDGNSESKLMLVGEAPGQNEDEQGIPFCGVSGRLLDKIFKYGGYTRDGNSKDNSFYITNTVFWRPPGNRKPLPEEIAMCKPFVEKHIALIDPKAIILVGGTAIESILAVKGSVTKLRNGSHKYYNKHLDKEIECFVIYHPSYLLRQPTQKKNAWADMLKIKKYLETT